MPLKTDISGRAWMGPARRFRLRLGLWHGPAAGAPKAVAPALSPDRRVEAAAARREKVHGR